MKTFFQRISGFAFCLGIFAIGTVPFYASLSHLMLVYQSQNWTETNGLVISSKICRSDGRRVNYSPEIIYRYTVDGKEYESKEISYGFREGSEREAYEKVSLYPDGSQVKVFYDPSSPEQVCLERGGATGGFAILIGVGIFFMSAGIWFTTRIRKKENRLFRPF